MDSNPLLRKVVGKLKKEKIKKKKKKKKKKMRESALVIFSHRIRDGIEKL